jgi:hypothetical protein
MSASVAEIKAALVMHRGDAASAAEELLAGPKMGPRKPKTHSMKTRNELGRGLDLAFPIPRKEAWPDIHKVRAAVLTGPAYWTFGESPELILFTTTFLFHGPSPEDARIKAEVLSECLSQLPGLYRALENSLKSWIPINQSKWKFAGLPPKGSDLILELKQEIRDSDEMDADKVSIDFSKKTATVVFGDQSEVLDFGLSL